jgi:hypothetical protein
MLNKNNPLTNRDKTIEDLISITDTPREIITKLSCLLTKRLNSLSKYKLN